MKSKWICFLFLAMPVFLFAQENVGFDDLDEFEQDVQSQVLATQVPDPLEKLNRSIWWVNDKLYFYFLKPVAAGYGQLIPQAGRTSIANAFENIKAPEKVVNNVLQMKFNAAGDELGRFVCNSTVGVLGLRDSAADKYKIAAHPEDFGQTLAHYGMDPVLALHLPVLGPSNLRDTLGMVPDFFLNPVSYIESLAIRISVHSEEVVNNTSLRLGLYEDLKAEQVDLYRFLQDAYEQKRVAQIEE